MTSRMKPTKVALRISAMLALAVGASACGANGDPSPGEDSATDDPDIAAVKAAVENGIPIPVDDYSSLIRLWAVNTRFNELRQICSGQLYRNNIVLTAAHCLQFTPEALAYGWPNISTNVNAVIVSTDGRRLATRGMGAPFYAPDRDLVGFKIANNIPVMFAGQVRTSGWTHTLSGRPANGYGLLVVGYGPPDNVHTSTICKYISLETGERLKGCVADPWPSNWSAGTAFNNGVEVLTMGVRSIRGDSGGPTKLFSFNGTSLADLPLVGINSFAYRCVSSGCGAVSVRLDDLGSWLNGLR
jgi:hypothetical protein